MTLIVCPLREVARVVDRDQPARIISLLSPDQDAPDIPTGKPWLLLRFHDISEPRLGLIAPDAAMVSALLAFGAAWREPEPLLIHCWMGISRSTAAVLILACALDPARDEAEVAMALRKASPSGTPNPRLVAIADDLLGRRGRIVAAAAGIGRGAEAWCGDRFELPARVVRRPSIHRP